MRYPTVSVIVPTYRRKNSLLRTLESLTQQTYPVDHIEVIVVDDGSDDGTEEACQNVVGPVLRLVKQSHLGGTAAKNRGAVESQNEFLFFVDDDITVNPYYIECLVEKHLESPHSVAMGVLHDIAPDTPYRILESGETDSRCNCREVTFTECLGGFFSMSHEDFLGIGKLQDPAPGFWPNWEDVDLAYRAHLHGLKFYKCAEAVGYHWDHVLVDLDTQCARWRQASQAAVLLIRKHPALEGQIPMLLDKSPVSWRKDSPSLILRKLVRQVASLPLTMWTMRHVVHMLERRAPTSTLQRLLHRWIISGHIYSGYREGLSEVPSLGNRNA